MSSSEITIVGGGWSARNVDLKKLRGTVIGVNDAARSIGDTSDIVISMDRLWVEHRWSWLQRRERTTWIRASALQNIPVKELENARQEGWLTRFACDHTLTWMLDRDEYSDPSLHGTNSGMCALNLAYQMRPERVFLIGFDCNRSPEGRSYFHSAYPWASHKGATGAARYQEWAAQYTAAARDFSAARIEVYNVSETSAIQVFKRMTPKQYARQK